MRSRHTTRIGEYYRQAAQSFPGVELILIGGQSAPSSIYYTVFCRASFQTLVWYKRYTCKLRRLGVPQRQNRFQLVKLLELCKSRQYVQLGIFRTDQFGSRFIVDTRLIQPALLVRTSRHDGYWSRSQRNNVMPSFGSKTGCLPTTWKAVG
jgi:hypothetical protein